MVFALLSNSFLSDGRAVQLWGEDSVIILHHLLCKPPVAAPAIHFANVRLRRGEAVESKVCICKNEQRRLCKCYLAKRFLGPAAWRRRHAVTTNLPHRPQDRNMPQNDSLRLLALEWWLKSSKLWDGSSISFGSTISTAKTLCSMSIIGAEVHFICAAAYISTFLPCTAASMGNGCWSGQVGAITIRPTTSPLLWGLHCWDKIMHFHLFWLPFTESFANLLLVSFKLSQQVLT